MNKQRLLLLSLILLAFFLRVWRLPQTPPGLWYDEAYYGMDALWMAETGHYPPFVPGNNGRESLWLYLLVLSTSLWGNTTFVIRWTASLAGLLTIPIMYRLALSLSDLVDPQQLDKRLRYRFALIATGWLAVSWWHLHISRAGFRLVLLPPLLMLSFYFFWRGWDPTSKTSLVVEKTRRRLTYFVLAGFFLGLSQYTYLPARLAPLLFVAAALVWTVQVKERIRGGPWFGLLITFFVAGLVFLPLGRFFWNHPETFSSRTGDVVFKADNLGEGIAHLLEGISLFFGAGHELYRHHLPGRAMLGWLEVPFFWLGLIWLLRPASLRRPETQWSLLGLLIMWLPALLASPPVHALRPIGLLPFYYLIVTVGTYQLTRLITMARWRTRYIPSTSRLSRSLTLYLFPLTFVIFAAFNTLINSYDYFWRWANHPEVYKEYNAPLVKLVNHLFDLTRTTDVLIPLHIYAHPTTRYLLWDIFPEAAGPPLIRANRSVKMLLTPDPFQLLYVANIPASSAWVLLTRDETGEGLAYVSRPPRAAEQLEINGLLASNRVADPFTDQLGRTLAQFISVTGQDKEVIAPLFETAPLRTAQINWAGLARLDGYEVTPDLVRPNRPISLNLYWHSLTDATFDDRLFLQLVDGTGNPINQWEGDAFREDMYRWRPNGILPSQHTLWLGPDTPPGPYFVRLGFFDPRTGQRLPIIEVANKPLDSSLSPLNQIHLGLFYVSPDGTDPRLPATPLSANFAEVIELIGVTLRQSEIRNPKSKIGVTFHWQDHHPTDKPYTVFLQLLNEEGEVVSGWDSQPFHGLYPTNLWSPGEIIADTFQLPLPETGIPSGTYHLISGFYDVETDQRLPVVGGGDFAELSSFEVH